MSQKIVIKRTAFKSTLIPIKKLQSNFKYMGISPKPYDYLSYRQINIEKKQSQSIFQMAYNQYNSDYLIRILRSIQQNPNIFMQIIGFNTNLSKTNKKKMLVKKILCQHITFDLWDVVHLLTDIRNQLDQHELYQAQRDMIQFFYIILTKVKFLINKYYPCMIMFQPHCHNFYIRRSEVNINGSKFGYQYSLVIGFDNLVACVNSSNGQEFIYKNIQNQIQKQCKINSLNSHNIKQNYDEYDNDKNGYKGEKNSENDQKDQNRNEEKQDQTATIKQINNQKLQQKQISFQKILAAEDNVFQNIQLPKYFIEAYNRKQKQYISQAEQQQIPESTYTKMVMNLLTNYSADIFFLNQAHITNNAIINMVYEKKQLKNIGFNQQYISLQHIMGQDNLVNQTFMSIFCQHFQGLQKKNYINGQKCIYCSKVLLVDQVKCTQRNKNLFHNNLGKNYLNPLSLNIVYLFKQKIFHLADPSEFSHYPHFNQYMKTHGLIRDRPEISLLMDKQRISLYNKLWGKKKFFGGDQMIQTPVRGKYCKHLEFFQLQRVYQQFLNKKHGEKGFQCFVCMTNIQYQEIMYLHEVKLLIDVAKNNFFQDSYQNFNVYLNVDNVSQTIELVCQNQGGCMKTAYSLPIYKTLIDPLTKSENNDQNYKKNIQDQEITIEYTKQFKNLFF